MTYYAAVTRALRAKSLSLLVFRRYAGLPRACVRAGVGACAWVHMVISSLQFSPSRNHGVTAKYK